MLHAKIGRQFLLECLGFRAKDVVAAMDDIENPAIDRFRLIDPRERNFTCQTSLLAKNVIRIGMGAMGKWSQRGASNP